MYAKVFSQIFDSSIAENYLTRLVFTDLLTLADVNGVVDMTHEAIARRTNVPIETVRAAITELESSDPKSRTPDEDGRRIARLDQHRDWGWLIVNYQRFREIRTQAERSEVNGYDSSRRGYVYYAVDGTAVPAHVKIGFSVNPWARLLELQTARPTLVLQAIEKGTLLSEASTHKRFASLRMDGEWFRLEGDLLIHLQSLRSYDSSGRSQRSSMQKEKQKQKEGERKPPRSVSHLSILDIKDVIAAKKEKAQDIKRRFASEFAMGTHWSDDKKREEHRSLRTEIKKLESEIAQRA